MPAAAEYGPLAELVAGAGCLIAAATAIGLNWRGRSRWEPIEEDLEKGARKVTGLLSAVCIALIWYWLRDPGSVATVSYLAATFASICVVALIVYGLLIAVFVYEQQPPAGPNQVSIQKIVGGFWITDTAKDTINRDRLTIQEAFAQAGYNPDKIWPRLSRALAKASFVLCYVCLTFTGTIALASASVLVAGKVDEPAIEPADLLPSPQDFDDFPSVQQVVGSPSRDGTKVSVCFKNETRDALDVLVYSCYAFYALQPESKLTNEVPLVSTISIAAGSQYCKCGILPGDDWICVYAKKKGSPTSSRQALACVDLSEYINSEFLIAASGGKYVPTFREKQSSEASR